MSTESERGEAAVAFERAQRDYVLKAAAKRVELAHVADKDLRESMVVLALESEYRQVGDLADRCTLLLSAFEDRAIAAQELTAQAHALAAGEGRLGPSKGFDKSELAERACPAAHDSEEDSR